MNYTVKYSLKIIVVDFNEVATDPVYNIKFIGSVHDSLQDIMSIIKSEIDKL